MPTMLLVYLVGFGIPALRRSTAAEWLPTEPVILGGIALTLSYGAYVAEVFRAGIAVGPPGQRAAALGAGADRAPGDAPRDPAAGGAARVPPLLNDFMALQKDTALVSIVGVIEAFRRAQIDPGVETSTTRR